MVALPAFLTVTTPFWSMAATSVSLLAQATVPVPGPLTPSWIVSP